MSSRVKSWTLDPPCCHNNSINEWVELNLNKHRESMVFACASWARLKTLWWNRLLGSQAKKKKKKSLKRESDKTVSKNLVERAQSLKCRLQCLHPFSSVTSTPLISTTIFRCQTAGCFCLWGEIRSPTVSNHFVAGKRISLTCWCAEGVICIFKTSCSFHKIFKTAGWMWN